MTPMIVDKVKILPIEKLDFSDAVEVGHFGHMLISAYRNCGGITATTNRSKRLLELEVIAQDWILGIGDNIQNATTDSIIQYLGWYDMLHRVAVRKPARSHL